MAFTIPSHLTTFNTPLAAFSASRPEFTDFVVGGLIFSASNEEGVKLEETEHQAFAWATEEEVREGVAEKGPYRFVGAGGRNLLKAFEMFNNSGTQIITECK